MLGPELESSTKAACALNHRASSLGHSQLLTSFAQVISLLIYSSLSFPYQGVGQHLTTELRTSCSVTWLPFVLNSKNIWCCSVLPPVLSPIMVLLTAPPSLITWIWKDFFVCIFRQDLRLASLTFNLLCSRGWPSFLNFFKFPNVGVRDVYYQAWLEEYFSISKWLEFQKWLFCVNYWFFIFTTLRSEDVARHSPDQNSSWDLFLPTSVWLLFVISVLWYLQRSITAWHMIQQALRSIPRHPVTVQLANSCSNSLCVS